MDFDTIRSLAPGRDRVERRIRLDQLSFRLLRAFVAVYDASHVGRAADSLGMSQPALSSLLAQLRRVAGDALFVRSAQRMQPTPLARSWIGPVRHTLATLEHALNSRTPFEPAHSSRRFVLYMSDVGQCILFNRLAARVEHEAPRVRLQVVSRWIGHAADRLDDGTLDLAFGWVPQLTARKSRVSLFDDRYVGLQAASAPETAPPRYAVAEMQDTAHQVVLERFAHHGVEPVVNAPTFLLLPELVAGTSLIGVVPERYARLLMAQRPHTFRCVALALRMPRISVRVHWSAHAHRDEGIRWLIGLIERCSAEYLTDDSDSAHDRRADAMRSARGNPGRVDARSANRPNPARSRRPAS